MRRMLSWLVVCYALFSPFVSCKDDLAHVIELTDDNFDRVIKDGIWMIDVYAPW